MFLLGNNKVNRLCQSDILNILDFCRARFSIKHIPNLATKFSFSPYHVIILAYADAGNIPISLFMVITNKMVE